MGKYLLGAIFIGAGVLHFVAPSVYARIMPPMLPAPLILVYVSGAAEIAGGLGLMVPQTRRAAAWGLAALLLAVWPANVYMAMNPQMFPKIPAWSLWARLPLQVPLIWWALVYARRVP